MNDSNLAFWLTLAVGIGIALSAFIEAYRIQKQNGVVKESKILFAIGIVFSLAQLIMIKQDLPLDLVYLVLGVTVIPFGIKFFFGSNTIKVYETTRERIVRIVEAKFSELDVKHELKDGWNSDEVLYHLYEEQAKLKISGGMLGEESKDFDLSFKGSWKSPRLEELQLQIIEACRKEKEHNFFLKQVAINCIMGVGILGIFSYFAWKFLQLG